ncbi:hypothetical protein [Endozoicomonas sp. ONNA2]|uniref:hypothetical protein n=1 Tax=Endozoicomonas sp. ONNA2 TaxID=2828741 RepID=UPI00214952E1|nr:hypothetical protein [Endozoicomonas sp. ONNA2]
MYSIFDITQSPLFPDLFPQSFQDEEGASTSAVANEEKGASTSAVTNIVPTRYIQQAQTENPFLHVYNDHAGCMAFKKITPSTTNAEKHCLPTEQIKGVKQCKNYADYKRKRELSRLYKEIKGVINSTMPLNPVKTRKESLLTCIWLAKQSTDPGLTCLIQINPERLKCTPKANQDVRKLVNNHYGQAYRRLNRQLLLALKKSLPGIPDGVVSQRGILSYSLSFIKGLPAMKKFKNQSAQHLQSGETTDGIKEATQNVIHSKMPHSEIALGNKITTLKSSQAFKEHSGINNQANPVLIEVVRQIPEETSTILNPSPQSTWSGKFVTKILTGHETADSLEND